MRVSFPSPGITCKNVGLIATRIEGYGQEYQFPAHLLLEALLKHAKIVGTAETEVWQSATGIDEVYGHDFAGEL